MRESCYIEWLPAAPPEAGAVVALLAMTDEGETYFLPFRGFHMRYNGQTHKWERGWFRIEFISDEEKSDGEENQTGTAKRSS